MCKFWVVPSSFDYICSTSICCLLFEEIEHSSAPINMFKIKGKSWKTWKKSMKIVPKFFYFNVHYIHDLHVDFIDL